MFIDDGTNISSCNLIRLSDSDYQLNVEFQSFLCSLLIVFFMFPLSVVADLTLLLRDCSHILLLSSSV